jgi:hypothetical protein
MKTEDEQKLIYELNVLVDELTSEANADGWEEGVITARYYSLRLEASNWSIASAPPMTVFDIVDEVRRSVCNCCVDQLLYANGCSYMDKLLLCNTREDVQANAAQEKLCLNDRLVW